MFAVFYTTLTDIFLAIKIMKKVNQYLRSIGLHSMCLTGCCHIMLFYFIHTILSVQLGQHGHLFDIAFQLVSAQRGGCQMIVTRNLNESEKMLVIIKC